MDQPNMRRRQVVAGAVAVIACPGVLHARTNSGLLSPTPSQTEGPFYPHHLSGDLDNDLLVADGNRYEEGQPAWVTGRVVDRHGAPLTGAVVEIWQCDHDGRYHHPRERGPANPAFQGFGRVTVSPDGSYRFRTMRPMPYPGRTPHIHFKVRQGGAERLTTQLYVKGEPGNSRDGLWRSLSPEARDALTRPFEEGSDGLAQAWFQIVV